MSDQDAVAGFFVVIFVGFILLISLGIAIWIAYLLYDGLLRIPKQHRTVEPYFAWLTLIPLAGVIFYWILLPFKIPESLKNYFSENPGNGDYATDFGKNMGLGAVISATLMIVPFINSIAWIPALVFLVLFLMQFRKMVKQIPQAVTVVATTHGSTNMTAGHSDKYSQLEKLKKLLDDGVLTEEEYKIEKQRLL